MTNASGTPAEIDTQAARRAPRRQLRNWWVRLAMDGQHTIEGGPAGPEGGFSIDIDQRSGAHKSRRVLSISGEPDPRTGDLVLQVFDQAGNKIKIVITKRDGLTEGE